MIDESQARSAHDGVFRLGGLAGIFGALLMFAAFLPVGLFAGGFAADPAEALMRFPDVRAAQAVEEVLYLGVIALWAVHFLALYRALRATSPAAALFGSGLGIMGLILLAAGALPHVATAMFSDLYHAPGTSPEDQATLVLSWQATQAIFDSLLVVGLVVLPPGLIALGVAMLGNPAFGKGFGGVSGALGAVGGVAACVLLADPASPIAAVGIFALIVFHLVLGWKVYSLSRNPAGILEDRGYTGNGVRAEGDFNSTEPII